MALEVAVDPSSLLQPADREILRAIDRNNWMCAISDGGGKIGTGILIGADLVLTNYHVLEALYAQPETAAKAHVRFDFYFDSAREVLSSGREVPFAAAWSEDLPKSRQSAKDEAGADTGFEPELVDYAVFRLGEAIGAQTVEHQVYGQTPRGWLTLPDTLGLPDLQSEIRVLQHPIAPDKRSAEPLKRSDGKVLALPDEGMRLRHDATTFGGSSGGACFARDFSFIALHQAGFTGKDGVGKWNQAIPISRIVAHMRQAGFDRLVGVAPPPRRASAPKPRPDERAIQLGEAETERRLRNAKMLMDRDDAESLVNMFREERTAGMLHVIACRHVDSHKNFLERLAHLALDKLGATAVRKRIAALLGAAAAAGEQPWARDSFTWPSKRYPATVALGMIKVALGKHLKSRRRMIIDAAAPIDDCDRARDLALLVALGQYLVDQKVTPDRMQLFVIYSDSTPRSEPDRFKATRDSLSQLWALDQPPAGCGACLTFDDVGKDDLNGWCGDLQEALKTDQAAFDRQIDLALPGGRRAPMLDVEDALTPMVRDFLQASLR